MVISEDVKTKQLGSSVDVAETFRAILKMEHEVDQDKEHFWTVGLTTKNQIKYIELVSLGTLTASLVHPREVFRFAVMKGVASILIVHNHSANNPSPSRDDIEITGRLKQAGEILGIKVLDHIIIGRNHHFSFIDNKML